MKSPILLILLAFSTSGIAQNSENEIVEVAKKRQLSSYEIVVAPNPSPNFVVVSAPEGAICIVHSSSGTYVGTWEIRGEGLQLDELGSGVFIAQITYGGEAITKRFVIL